jgi:aryl-phospho-beta-D-glucosidase BglC (GH1 family)
VTACKSSGSTPEPLPSPLVEPACEANAASVPARTTPAAAPSLPWLHVAGRDLVDESGQLVSLRGMNFGNWLLLESWMAGLGTQTQEGLLAQIPDKAQEFGVGALIQASRDSNSIEWLAEARPRRMLVEGWREYSQANVDESARAGLSKFWDWFDAQPWVFEEDSLWYWLQQRFGRAQSDALRTTYADHQITEADVERLASLGLNFVRLPIWYRELEEDTAQGPRFRQAGWDRVDRFMSWARAHKVYVLLDLHGAPGGQSVQWHSGLANGGHLWTRPDCIARTTNLWSAIARHFADDPHVMGYDLLNEPGNFASVDDYRGVHDALYKAIRAVDPKHVVVIEDGYQPPERLASPKEMGWENAMFSVHLYPGGSTATEYGQRIEGSVTSLNSGWARFDCPLLLGEFNSADPGGGKEGDPSRLAFSPAAMDNALGRLNRRGVHWAIWSWKFWTDQSTWGLLHPTGAARRIDLRDGSFPELQKAFESLDTAGFTPNDELATVLSARARDAIAAQDLDPAHSVP